MKLNHLEAARLYAAGHSTVQIAQAFDVAPHTVYMALKRRGVQMRGISEAVSIRKRGSRTVANGYVFIRVAKGQRVREHVLIAERALGRKLKRNEHVHHINGDKTDNRNENLLICTHGYHIELHWRMKHHDYWKHINQGEKK